ncbi:MAG: hypothetical protein H0Z37_06815 [Firmicutes bacterium]|nr:hypothetical protein [Bacillota bacterium]
MSTGLWVALIGAVVALIGWNMMPGALASGIFGFGLAHIVLGVLDAALQRRSLPQKT